MYNNIGKKIKILAKVIFGVEAVLTFIIGLALLGEDAVSGLLVLIIGPIIGWVSSWVLYGFGELVENVKEIKEVLPKKAPETKKYKDYYDSDDLM